MPELPEIETIKRQLAQKIVGKKLKGKKIVGLRRRAKVLIIDFKDRSSLVFHLKLTGQLIFNAQPGKQTRQVFNFDDGTKLVFNDTRKFGWYKFLKSSQKLEQDFGPEPLTKNFNIAIFRNILAKRPRAKIKPLLMDQKFIAGIGNIYSDEILFAAGVRPNRQVKTLKQKEIEKIFQNIKKILQAAIKHRGSSVEYYLDACGQKGNYIKHHQVYQKEKCPGCGRPIAKIKLGGRSSHYCLKCQK